MRNILALLLSLMLASGAAFADDQSADASQDTGAAVEQPADDAGSASTDEQSATDTGSDDDTMDENAGDSE
jgi:hypothetical protein